MTLSWRFSPKKPPLRGADSPDHEEALAAEQQLPPADAPARP